MVLMDESAENVVAADLRPGYRLGTRSGIGRLKVEAPMRSGPVVVLDVRAKDALQVAPAEDKDVVEAFSSNIADPSLGERVRPRRTDGCLHRRESFRSKHFIEGTWELCVSVPEQDVLALKVSRDREVSSLLGDPGRVGSAGGAGEMDSPRGELELCDDPTPGEQPDEAHEHEVDQGSQGARDATYQRQSELTDFWSPTRMRRYT
jgi:hypothetical protein